MSVAKALRETLHYDVIIVGAGPAGLAAAWRLAQEKRDLSICLVEKSARIGGHLLSGALLDPNDLTALIPDWRQKNAPLGQVVMRDDLYWFTDRHARFLPVLWDNLGYHMVSLGVLCRWLAKLVEAEGVEIYPGFAANRLLWHHHRLIGIGTKDQGCDQEGRPKPGFQPGIDLYAPITLLAEGCRGFLSQQVIQRLELAPKHPPQTYALGFKELWETSPHPPGEILHALGWPINRQHYGGGFLYQLTEDRASVGWIVGLDYQNPFFNPLESFQLWKSHPLIHARLRDGRPLGYGARTLVEGGWQALPRLVFEGGLLIGDAAGFLDAARLKGIGNAMRSGLAAAESVLTAFKNKDFTYHGLKSYPETIENAPWTKKLKAIRNIRPGFRWGLMPGVLNAAWEHLTKGYSPWTLQWRVSDRHTLHEAKNSLTLPSLQPDGRLTFDRSFLLSLAALTHRADQPIHLQMENPQIPLTLGKTRFANPETRYCPAGVFQMKASLFRIHAANCLHCKCCDIKDPCDNIRWTPPEGGSGPDFGEM